MIKLEYFVVCEEAIIDSETNAITLVRVLEDISLPVTGFYELPRLVAVASWNAGPQDSVDGHTASLLVTPPNVPTVTFETRLAAGRSRHRVVMTITGIPIQATGELKIELQLDGRHNATHTVTVHPPEQAPISGGHTEQFKAE